MATTLSHDSLVSIAEKLKGLDVENLHDQNLVGGIDKDKICEIYQQIKPLLDWLSDAPLPWPIPVAIKTIMTFLDSLCKKQ